MTLDVRVPRTIADVVDDLRLEAIVPLLDAITGGG